LSVAQLEDVRRAREAPTLVISGTYVSLRRRHLLMMLISFIVENGCTLYAQALLRFLKVRPAPARDLIPSSASI
jgi:hypothetical protein